MMGIHHRLDTYETAEQISPSARDAAMALWVWFYVFLYEYTCTNVAGAAALFQLCVSQVAWRAPGARAARLTSPLWKGVGSE